MDAHAIKLSSQYIVGIPIPSVVGRVHLLPPKFILHVETTYCEGHYCVFLVSRNPMLPDQVLV